MMLSETKMEMYKNLANEIDELVEDYPETVGDLFKDIVHDLYMEHENLRLMIEANRKAKNVMKKYMKIKK